MPHDQAQPRVPDNVAPLIRDVVSQVDGGNDSPAHAILYAAASGLHYYSFNGASLAELRDSRGRPSFHETMFKLAKVWAERATCPRLSVGAVIVNADHQVLATGYNGSVRGHAHCLDHGCVLEGDHCVRAVHAEANALMQAARVGVSVNGALIYVTHTPCIACAKLLAQAGVGNLLYLESYRPADPLHLRWSDYFDGVLKFEWDID